MKKLIVISGSVLLHLCICLIEWIVWDFVPAMSGFDGYNLYEKGYFLLLFLLTLMAVFFLIKGEKTFGNAAVFWLTFLLADRVIRLRLLIAEITNSFSYVYGPNFLGEDTWTVCYIGCIVGTVVAIAVKMIKHSN